MTQYHARRHFGRIELVDSIRQRIINNYCAQWTGPVDPVIKTPRYERLCRIVATYRMAGYLNPQEL